MLDIFYLLAYRETLSKKSVVEVFTERFSKQDFSRLEGEVIEKYLDTLSISTEFIKPLAVMSWLNHIGRRYGIRQQQNMGSASAWINLKNA